MDRRLRYYALFCFSQACGIVSVILLLTYILDKASLKWKTENLFLIHGFIMVLGLVYTQGTAISAFRALNSIEKQYVKIAHVVLHITTFAMNIIALVAIFDFKTKVDEGHLITFQGWCGLITVILFSAQVVFSFITYFFPKASENVRKAVMPYHRNIGLTLFSLALTTALIELNGLQLGNRAETVWICILLLLFGIFTFISVIHKKFRRDNIFD